jgi:hypothetical protein
VRTNGILECKFWSKNEHRASGAAIPSGPTLPLTLPSALTPGFGPRACTHGGGGGDGHDRMDVRLLHARCALDTSKGLRKGRGRLRQTESETGNIYDVCNAPPAAAHCRESLSSRHAAMSAAFSVWTEFTALTVTELDTREEYNWPHACERQPSRRVIK